MKTVLPKSEPVVQRAAAAHQQGKSEAVQSLPAVGGVMQLYKNTYVAKLKTNYESENSKYFLKDTSGNASLYGDPLMGTPHYCTKVNDDVNGSGIARYEPSDKFYADCLHTAEEIMQQARLVQGGINSKEKTTGNRFGEGIQKNWNVVKGVDGMDSNENANPLVGNAFAVVGNNTHSYTGGVLCQYHAAAVVAVDGTDRITMEVFGNPDKKNRTEAAKFGIYDTDPMSGHTFHDAWGSQFKNGITVALEPA